MKKVMLLGFLLFPILFSGCNIKSISINQSKTNFIAYYSSIENALITYELEIYECFNPNIENNNYSFIRDFVIDISSISKIEIRLYNESNRERYSINYINTLSNTEDVNENIIISLFVELVNIVSGEKITENYCKDFLEAPEEKYPASSHGFQKLNGEIISKIRRLNFLEDWSIEYYLSKDLTETLGMGGLTK